MCCWQLVFSFFGKSNILISFLQNSINKAYNGMAGACGVSSPGLSSPGAGKDLGCSAPGSASCRLLLPFLAATGPALPSECAWLDTLVLCGEVIPGSLPPPPTPMLCLHGTAAAGGFGSIGSITAKPQQISPGSGYAVGHGHDVLLPQLSSSPGGKCHRRSHHHPRWWYQRWWTGTVPGELVAPSLDLGCLPGACGWSAYAVVVPGVVQTLPAAAWPVVHRLLLQPRGQAGKEGRRYFFH